MILSRKKIQNLLDIGVIKITPKAILKDASVKVHLSSQISIPGSNFTKVINYKLKPKEFILAKSMEKITFNGQYAGLYDGYTHLARQGIITHLGSMFVDPDTDNHITLEIFNASGSSFILEEGMRVGHLIILPVG